MTERKWCRKVEGQEHVLEFKDDGYLAHCHPMRSWVRELLMQPPPPSAVQARRLRENWECFHWEQCTRCRRKTRLVIFKDECPTARWAGVPADDAVETGDRA